MMLSKLILNSSKPSYFIVIYPTSSYFIITSPYFILTLSKLIPFHRNLSKFIQIYFPPSFFIQNYLIPSWLIILYPTSSKFILIHPNLFWLDTTSFYFIQFHLTLSWLIQTHFEFIQTIIFHRDFSNFIQISVTPSYFILISSKSSQIVISYPKHHTSSYFFSIYLTSSKHILLHLGFTQPHPNTS